MDGRHDEGATHETTMRYFDEACLPPAPMLSPEDMGAIREDKGVCQGVFARYLNVSANLVSDWERGQKRPGGSALRLLSNARNNGLSPIA